MHFPDVYLSSFLFSYELAHLEMNQRSMQGILLKAVTTTIPACGVYWYDTSNVLSLETSVKLSNKVC